MIIYLVLNRDGKLELIASTDKYTQNPSWAVNWASKNIPAQTQGSNQFSTLQGVLEIPGNQILSFLNEYQNNLEGDFRVSKIKIELPTIAYVGQHQITSTIMAKDFCSKIELLLKEEKIDPGTFELLVELPGGSQEYKKQLRKIILPDVNTEKGCKELFL
jgi:hypothetical protein